MQWRVHTMGIFIYIHPRLWIGCRNDIDMIYSIEIERGRKRDVSHRLLVSQRNRCLSRTDQPSKLLQLMQLQPLRCSPWPRSCKQLDTFQHKSGKFHHSTILPFYPPDPKKAYRLTFVHTKEALQEGAFSFRILRILGKIANFVQLKTGDDPWRLKNITYYFFVFHSRYLYFRHCQWWRFPGLLPFLSNNCFPKPLQFLQVHKSSSSSSEWNFWNLLIKSWMFSLPVFCKREGGEPVIHK